MIGEAPITVEYDENQLLQKCRIDRADAKAVAEMVQTILEREREQALLEGHGRRPTIFKPVAKKPKFGRYIGQMPVTQNSKNMCVTVRFLSRENIARIVSIRPAAKNFPKQNV